MPKNIYQGRRYGSMNLVVTVNQKTLPLRLDLRNHSPTGFEWGYAGSGPAQLALAILAHEWDDERAERWYQLFKMHFIAPLKQNEGWKITSEDIARWEKTLEGYRDSVRGAF